MTRLFSALLALGLVACDPVEVRFPPDFQQGGDVFVTGSGDIQFFDDACFDVGLDRSVIVTTSGGTGTATYYVTDGETLEVHDLPLIFAEVGYEEFSLALPQATAETQQDGLNTQFACTPELVRGVILRDRLGALTDCHLFGADSLSLEVAISELEPDLFAGFCEHLL